MPSVKLCGLYSKSFTALSIINPVIGGRLAGSLISALLLGLIRLLSQP
jgi:hypothetical protein